MNSLIDLGLAIGTVIGFPLWCGFVLACLTAVLYRHSQRFRKTVIWHLYRLTTYMGPLLHRPLISHITGNQGFSVQPKIFEQNLTARIHILLSKLRDALKIHR